ncbi:MAG: HK97 family phage prohead protease [Beijerinckiaceae bacterium]|nr:HK97 family phage prohead protease [Beijerinckiaceae bacterium]
MRLTREQKAQIGTEVYWRDMRVESTRAASEGERVAVASLSSDAEIVRWFGREKLIHEPGAVDLARAAYGLPMLWNHDASQPIGVVRALTFDGGKLRGELHFATNAKALEVWRDVEGGFLSSVSIGYRIKRYTESTDSDLLEVIEWELHEASIVAMPADISVGVGRSANFNPAGDAGHDGKRASDMRTGQGNEGGQGNQGGQVVNFEQGRALALAEGEQRGREAEAARRDGIAQVFASPRFQGPAFEALRRTAEADGWSVDSTQRELLNLIGREGFGPAGGSGGFAQDTATRYTPGALPSVQAGEDGADKWMRGAELSILVRAGVETGADAVREARGGEFTGMALHEVARDFCRMRGIPLAGLNRERVVAALSYRASGVIAYGTGDFTGLLENIASKSLLRGYAEHDETWPMIARVGSLPDFKQASRVGLSEMDDLDMIRPNGEYKLARPNDRAEKLALNTFGKLFRLGRVAIVNDDTAAFTEVPRKFGRAAKRQVGDQVFAVFTSNPTMNQDGIALFHASHNNLISSGTGAPSVAQLSKMKTGMGLQKDSANAVNGLNIRLSRVIVPLALQDVAMTVRTSEQDPATSVSAGTTNIHRNTFEVVADPRLDAASSQIWYGAADPNLYDTIEVAFLDGVQEPYLEAQEAWTIDGVEWKVRIDCVAIPLDWRTMQRNNG